MTPKKKSNNAHDKLISCFIISGLDVDSELTTTDEDSTIDPFKRFYKSKLLFVYPEDVSQLTSADLNTLIHPFGVRLRAKDDQIDLQSSYHPFVVTHEDASTLYGATLTFYEQVLDKQTISAMSSLQNMYYATTGLDRCEFNADNHTLVVNKAITFICKVPLLETCRRLLYSLHEQACYTSPPWKCGHLESLVHNALEEISVPLPGCSVRITTGTGAQFICQRPDKRELPLYDYCLKKVFSLIKIDNLISVLTCAMLEYQIILYSDDLERLMLLAETIQSLLFPFEWPFLYAPILPSSASDYVLDVPQPYICGVHRDMGLSLEQLKANSSQVCILNIDCDDLLLPEDVIRLPYHDQLADDIDHVLRSHQDGSWFSHDHRDESTISTKLELLHATSDVVSEIVSIARKTGVLQSVHDIESRISDSSLAALYRQPLLLHHHHDQHTDLLMNSELRHVFLRHSMRRLSGFQSCVKLPDRDRFADFNEYFATRESRFNFDATTFVSEKPSSSMGFYYKLVETQAFCFLVDETISQLWNVDKKKLNDSPNHLQLFNYYVDEYVKSGTHEYPTEYTRSDLAIDAAKHIEGRYAFADIDAPKPHPLDGITSININNNRIDGSFPTLSVELLKRNQIIKKTSTLVKSQVNRRPKNKADIPLKKNISTTNTPNFIKKLGEEFKSKSRRLLLTKVSMQDVKMYGVDDFDRIAENTLISGLCDMLERTFSHGLLNKQGKSHLWNYLMEFKNSAETRGATISMLSDIRFIESLERVCTDMGKARAFVRLSLEKKCLSKAFQVLLSDSQVLSKLYKEDAVVRSDEDMLMNLTTLLTLNTVDFFCFTENFTDAVITYKVHIVTSKSSTAKCWLDIKGSLFSTTRISVHGNKFTFKNKNLGHLETMRLCHDNSGLSPKWVVDHIIIINTITDQVNKFSCGQAISIVRENVQRLLIAEKVPHNAIKDIMEKANSNSPVIRRKQKLTAADVNRIHDNLSNSINVLVKNCLSADDAEKQSLTVLLCGEQGLIRCIEEVMSYGFKSNRFFRQNYTLWDFIVKANDYFKGLLDNKVGNKVGDKVAESLELFRSTCSAISQHHVIGNQGMYEVFMLVAVRDKYLANWIRLLARSPVTSQMYDEYSFMRDQHLHRNLFEVVQYLKSSVDICPDAALFQGIDI